MAKRSLDQLIGLVGSFIGIIMGAIGIILQKIPYTNISLGESETMILFSIIGLVGALLVTSRKKDAGMVMIVIGLAGIIALPNIVTIIPFAIILVAGIISRL